MEIVGDDFPVFHPAVLSLTVEKFFEPIYFRPSFLSQLGKFALRAPRSFHHVNLRSPPLLRFSFHVFTSCGFRLFNGG